MTSIALSNALRQDGQYEIDFFGIRISFRYRRGTGRSLVFLFHGAYNQNIKPYPVFQPLLPLTECHQISIADPTLLISKELAAGWYVGSQFSPLQDLLSEFIASVASILDVTRRVYLGGSSGGFAAMYYSWRDAGSIAIGANPQTSLKTYLADQITSLRLIAWPNTIENDLLADQFTMDLGPLYSSCFVNSVIYLQSAGDRRHLFSQFSDFLAEVSSVCSERLILNVGFWGKLGHSGAVPAAAYIPWVQSALVASTLKADDLLTTHHAILANVAATKAAVSRTTRANAPPLDADLRMADLLRKVQIEADCRRGIHDPE